MVIGQGFSKCIFYHFLDILFANIFTIYWILQIKCQSLKIRNSFENSKSRVQDLFNGVSFIIFGHQTWDLEVKLTPPRVSWFSSTPARIGLSFSEKIRTFSSQNTIHFLGKLESFSCKRL